MRVREPRLSCPWAKKRADGCAEPKKDREQSGKFCDVLSVGRLEKARRVALRRRVWFKALNRVERGILDLTLRYVDNIRSAKLAKVLTAILTKLKLATETIVDRMVRVVGVSLAHKISDIAVSWGNLPASEWAEDLDFARYLAVNFPSKPTLV